MNWLRSLFLSFIFLFLLLPNSQNKNHERNPATNSTLDCVSLIQALSPFKEVNLRKIDLEKVKQIGSKNFEKNYKDLVGQDFNFEEVVGFFASNLPEAEKNQFYQNFQNILDSHQVQISDSKDWLPFQFNEKSVNYFGFNLRDKKINITWGTQKIKDEDHLFKLVTKFIDVYARMQFVPLTSYNVYNKSFGFNKLVDSQTEAIVERLVNQYFTFEAFGREMKPKWYLPWQWPPLLSFYRDSIIIPEGSFSLGLMSIPQIGFFPYLFGSMASSSMSSLVLSGLWKKGLATAFYLSPGWKKIYEAEMQAGLYQHLRKHLGFTQSIRFAHLHLSNIQAVAFVASLVALAPVIVESTALLNSAGQIEVDGNEESWAKEIIDLSKLSPGQFTDRIKKSFHAEDYVEYEQYLFNP